MSTPDLPTTPIPDLPPPPETLNPQSTAISATEPHLLREEVKKPLLSKDTLYEPVIYSGSAIEAPPPYAHRLEYDRTNPVNVPPSLDASRFTLITYPTRYPLLHNYHISCPDLESLEALRESMAQQYSKQRSPLYMMYRSQDYNPRVVTKDQIPGIIHDDYDPREKHFLPTPLISLNIPTVSNVIHAPYHSSAYTILSGGAFGGILGATTRATRNSTLKSYLPIFNSNMVAVQSQPLSMLHHVTHMRIYGALTGGSSVQGAFGWSAFTALRNEFLLHQHNRDDLFRDSEFSLGFASNGSIGAESSPEVYSLPYALSIKLPPVFTSPVDRTAASVKASLIVAPFMYFANYVHFHRAAFPFLTSTIGNLPYDMRAVGDKLNPQLIAQLPTSSTIKPTKATVSAIATAPPPEPKFQQPFPQYGLINKRFYEAFLYDHGSPHLYSMYEQGNIPQATYRHPKTKEDVIDFRPKAIKGFLGGAPSALKAIFFPSQERLKVYNEMMTRFAGNRLHVQGIAKDQLASSPLFSPPVWLSTTASRFKFHLTGLACAMGLWAHLNTSIFAYEFYRQRQMTASGRPPYIRELFLGENPNADKVGIDKAFQNEIMHVPNLAVPDFVKFYNLYKQKHRDSWTANLAIERDDMLSQSTKLSGIRALSESNIKYQDHVDVMEKRAHEDILAFQDYVAAADQYVQEHEAKKKEDNKYEYPPFPSQPISEKTKAAFEFMKGGESTPGINTRSIYSVWFGIMSSFFTSFLFHPWINAQNREIMSKLTGIKVPRSTGSILYTFRSVLLHSAVLLKMAFDDGLSYKNEHDIIRNSVLAKIVQYSVNPVDPGNLNFGPFARRFTSNEEDAEQLSDRLSSLDQQLCAQDMLNQTHRAYQGYYEKELFTEKLILPTQNPNFYQDLESSKYLSKPGQFEVQPVHLRSTGENIVALVRSARAMPGMFGYSRSYSDDQRTPEANRFYIQHAVLSRQYDAAPDAAVRRQILDQIKELERSPPIPSKPPRHYLLTRGQYFLPSYKTGLYCDECASGRGRGPSHRKCWCDTIDQTEGDDGRRKSVFEVIAEVRKAYSL